VLRLTTPVHEGFRTADGLGVHISMLPLRLFLAYEFWESGVEKFYGQNWFADIKDQFPFPSDAVSVDVSWSLSTWFELIGAVALVIGLGTRFLSVALVALTLVAIASVHAGLGYNVCSNGWKLPLMCLVMFVPLILSGPSMFSLDAWIRCVARCER
jgi:putative oxidoreductase